MLEVYENQVLLLLLHLRACELWGIQMFTEQVKLSVAVISTLLYKTRCVHKNDSEAQRETMTHERNIIRTNVSRSLKVSSEAELNAVQFYTFWYSVASSLHTDRVNFCIVIKNRKKYSWYLHSPASYIMY